MRKVGEAEKYVGVSQSMYYMGRQSDSSKVAAGMTSGFRLKVAKHDHRL